MANDRNTRKQNVVLFPTHKRKASLRRRRQNNRIQNFEVKNNG